MKNYSTIFFFMFLLPIFNCKRIDKNFEDANLSNWMQKHFILSTFNALGVEDQSLYENALFLTQEAGIDMVELTFINSDNINRALVAAEKVGIKVLVEDLDVFSGFQDQIVPTFDEKKIIDRINKIKKNKHIMGYYIWDEPHEKDFEKVRYLRNLVKKIDGNRLPFSVLFPSYGIYKWNNGTYPQYVDNYLRIVNPDVLSFDYYPFRKTTDQIITNDLWRDFGYLRRKSLEYNRPLWFYFQAVPINPGDIAISTEMIKAQMYSALCYGVKGLSYYKVSNFLYDSFAQKSGIFDEIKKINTKVKNIGNYLFDKKSEKIYHTGIKSNDSKLNLYFLDDFENSELLKFAPPNLVIGIFSNQFTNKKYVCISNLRHDANIEGDIELKQSKKISLYDAEKNNEILISYSTDLFGIRLSPGEGALYILE